MKSIIVEYRRDSDIEITITKRYHLYLTYRDFIESITALFSPQMIEIHVKIYSNV